MNIVPTLSTTRFPAAMTHTLLQNAHQKYSLTLAEDTKSFVRKDQKGEIIYQLFPPSILPCQHSSILSYLDDLKQKEIQKSLVLLIRSGAASLGISQGDELLRHKVITKYVTRKKQGKSQFTYLKKKGKSRLGSRIRLQNMKDFFVEINEKLCQWEELVACQFLFYSAPVRLWPELFTAKTTIPISRQDPRWHKIPIYIRTPNFKELKHICYELSHGTIIDSSI